MASWTTHRFGSAEKMTEFLNGLIRGTRDVSKGIAADGLTFVFDKGGGDVTVTFPAKLRDWTISEVVDRINATEASLAHIKNVAGLDRRIAIMKDLASLTIKSTGTINPLLGFNAAADTVSDMVVDTEVYSAGPEPGEQSWIVVRYA